MEGAVAGRRLAAYNLPESDPLSSTGTRNHPRGREIEMGNRLRVLLGYRARDVVVVLTLFSHFMVTIGVPLPAASRMSKDCSRPYPCQNRPCGCLTADLCWKGDCCCFTLEEKLAWAEDNGIEPPEHVRPLVESRKARPAHPKKKSCCPEHASTPSPPVSVPPTCCDGKLRCEASPVAECPHCDAESSKSCQKIKPTHDRAAVRWVVGIFAQKCRGEGPAGLFQLDPAIVPNLIPVFIAEPERLGQVVPPSDRTTSMTYCPPSRPPRSC